MTEFVKIINSMADLGYALSLNTSGRIVFTQMIGNNTLIFEDWNEVGNFTNKEKA